MNFSEYPPTPSQVLAEQVEFRVLLVDDDPQIRAALARLLRAQRVEVIVAATAEEALSLVDGIHVAVVITDLRMPGMGGLALLQKLVVLHPEARFIVITGAPVDTQLFPTQVHVQLFRKPFVREALIDAVMGVRSQRQSSRPPSSERARPPARVLLVEDSRSDAALFSTAVKRSEMAEFEVTHVQTLAQARELVRDEAFDVICLDLNLPDSEGPQTILKMQAEAPEVGLIVMSQISDEALALRAIQAGAQDFLVKGKVGGQTIGKALRYAMERKHAELRVTEMALTDPLTGLCNRVSFRQRVAKALARCRAHKQHFAVLLLDLDRFKPINDALGHDAGDVFLTRIAARLCEAVRPSDLVARLGGDEFAIVLEPVRTEDDVEYVARRILHSLTEPMELSGTTVRPTASLGAAIFPRSGHDADQLLAAADTAMYVVKGSGRNGIHVHGCDMNSAASTRLVLEAQLRSSVDSRSFQLFYQPQVDRAGRLYGVEALLRWPAGGAVTPPIPEMIRVLEETGLILELGPWIFDEACRQLRSWRNTGCTIPHVSVNLSLRQFAAFHLEDQIVESTKRWQLEPTDVVLEITETTLLSEASPAPEVLTRLAKRGYQIALDDFGTGYCSLAYLQRFPIHSIKIDKSFVMDLDSNRRKALVGGILDLAHRLELAVVAEGVETEEQEALLLYEDCPYFQGYRYGRPVPAEDIAVRALSDSAWRASVRAGGMAS